MRVAVKLVGFPDLQARLGADPVDVEFDGSTLGDLLRWLQRTHGDPAHVRLLGAHGGARAAGAGGAGAAGADGQLDPDIVVLRNGRHPLPLDAELSDGDLLTLVVVVAGG
ncbi:MAG: MoaD/ThiS family protein [Deferrisomatales bacterium]|nr:MoaD/ThiS family protein [Deferrisomatales bacterium]